ncbi:MAG: ABC transporter substrate-binding protein [Mesorhizobium sp.]|uniref:ABC transporter substrate-binding protein n=1 Tax=unclassified Mesorhizobium TaxID=325217 RepID=UPI000FCAC541|nr:MULTISPECIES: ABC transporter substrate-binding protein [unclassified Mesorhizobium]RUV77388.1 ABC transporter substrate-binding protein [Mesorhizobium sp. M5C.F.Cr.IN.023.01.1.1]RWI43915.1 MAG: ABC transporter substrate-binding protein [Mesorhizobium sp.]RWJ27792.1 MAG: ABC transporter substrate-binding protein [Mesorhizobium sp.]RWJ92661.1 MAG: ABC transporter substrate-binding protein [Mesorhizobium sp.]TIR04764.1 MAG: extracellular solute-binding protein [Mesorhizobium sp.]
MKTVAMILAAGVAAAAMPAQAETKLNVYYAWPEHEVIHKPIADRFMADHPEIKISFRAAAPSYDEAVQTLIRQSMAGELPDVHYVGFNVLRPLVTRGLVKPIDDLVAADHLADKGYTEQILSLARIEGHLYGLPFAMSTPVVYYNADLVKQAGGDPDKVPTDWDSFVALAGKVGALGNGTSGMYYQLGSDDWATQNLVRNFGGQMMNDKESDIAFDGPAGQAAVKLFKWFHTDGAQPAIDSHAARQLFTSGKLGFFFASAGSVSGFEGEIGDRFKLRTAKQPLGAEDATMPTGGMVAIILTDDPAKRAAAWDYVKFTTSPEGQSIVVPNTGYMPTNTLALDKDHLAGFYDKHPNWYTSVLQTPRARPWFSWPGDNGVQIGEVLRDEMTAIALGSKEPEAALADMVSEVRALLPKTN